MNERLIIFITSANRKEADGISRKLVRDKLAACVNIIENIDSLFWWNGKVDTAKEVLLIVKSRKANLKAIYSLVKAIHSYEVPEIIAIPIVGGEKTYLKWLDDSCKIQSGKAKI